MKIERKKIELKKQQRINRIASEYSKVFKKFISSNVFFCKKVNKSIFAHNMFIFIFFSSHFI